MLRRRDKVYRHRWTANETAPRPVFKYGGSEVTHDDDDDDIVVYYWSAPQKSVDNTSDDMRQQQRLTSVTAASDQQQQLVQQKATSSPSSEQSSVHSAALVLVIAGIFVTLTLTSVATLVVFWRKSNIVFALQKCEQRDADDQDAVDEDGAGTESDSDGEGRSRAGSGAGQRQNAVTGCQIQWMRLRNHDDDDAVDIGDGASSVGYHRRDRRLPADRPDHVALLMRPAASEAERSVSSTRLTKSRSESRVDRLSTTDIARNCRMTSSKSTVDWTAMYNRPS